MLSLRNYIFIEPNYVNTYTYTHLFEFLLELIWHWASKDQQHDMALSHWLTGSHHIAYSYAVPVDNAVIGVWAYLRNQLVTNYMPCRVLTFAFTFKPTVRPQTILCRNLSIPITFPVLFVGEGTLGLSWRGFKEGKNLYKLIKYISIWY
jgi:hypothetical protein